MRRFKIIGVSTSSIMIHLRLSSNSYSAKVLVELNDFFKSRKACHSGYRVSMGSSMQSESNQ